MTSPTLPKNLGRYKIVRELGRGAMGVVYEGQDPQIGRRVALKTARRDLIASPQTSPDTLERFYREARVAGMLNHPNIVTVYDAGEEDGTAFIAMEYVDGVDLGARTAKGPRFSPEEAVELVAALAEALAFAHDHGVVHRDIKPANIMLSRNGPPKLADFGIAHVLDSTLTQEGALIGSPTYMSPEQFMGQRVDNRSDLFSLGVVLYELLTGERPFTGAAFSTVMHNVLKTDPVQPHELNFAIDEALSKVVMTAIAKAPQDRYRDGRAFAEALRNTVKAAPETAAPSISSDVTVRMHADGFFADATPGGGSSVQDRSVSADASNHLTGSDTRTTIVAARRHQGTRLSFSAVIALSVLLAGALSLLYLQRRPKSEVPFTPSAPSSVVLDTPQDPLDTAVQPGLKVSIYSTAYENEVYAYQDAFNRQGDTAAYLREAEAAGRIQLLRGAGYSVAVYDSANPSQPFSTESLTEDGYAQLELPDTAQRVTFKIYQGKTMLLSVELSAAACLNSQTFLIPPNRANPANAPVP